MKIKINNFLKPLLNSNKHKNSAVRTHLRKGEGPGARPKVKILLTAMIFATAFANAQQVIQLEPFTQIKVRSAASVRLINGENGIILPEGADPSQYKWNIKDNTLIIEGRPQSLTISAKEINEIEVQGTGSLTATDTLRTTNLKLSISGSGSVTAPVSAQTIKAEISGVGSVTLSGNATSLDVEISGSGKVNAENLTVKNATAEISGSGNAIVDVTDNLNVEVSGSGSVYYKNKPANIHESFSGVGRVRQLGDAGSSDTTHIKIGNMNIDISGHGNDSAKFKNTPRKSSGNWAGFDIGFNGFFNTSGNTNPPDGYDFLELVPEKSIAVNFNFYDFDLKLYRRYVIGTTGIGLSYNNYRFRKDMTLIPDTSTIWFTPDTINYKKNKLTVSYLTVPLLITFNTHELAKKSFHITTGVLFAYKLGSHTKQVYDEDGEKKKDKEHDDFNINPFRTDLTLRVGYREVTVFANYALTHLFKSNQGPELHPWTVGVSLAGW